MTTLEPPRIDDRTYRELLAEVTARIPVHNPEWVNHNDSDPGMTLLQLWAFMTENLLYQAGRIPERVRVTFLELLGISPAPATAARGVVAFSVTRGRLEAVTIPADREVLAGRVPFRTTTGLTAVPAEVRPYVKRRRAAEEDLAEQYALLYGSFLQDAGGFEFYETEPVAWSATGTAPLDLDSTVDGTVWLAVLARRPAEVAATREVLGGQVLTLGVVPDLTGDTAVLHPAGSSAGTATAVLEFHVPDVSSPLPGTAAGRVPRYRPVESRTDGNVLVAPGTVELLLPAADGLGTWTDLEPLESGVGRFPPALEGEDDERLVTWIRVRPAGGGDGADVAGRAAARLSWLGANAALVEQRAHVARELVGTGTGRPDQQFRLANVPVLLDSVTVTVDGESWALVDDLLDAGPEVPASRAGPDPGAPSALPSRVVRVVRASGEVFFGNGLHGARPPRGAPIVATYDFGGGRQGLVGIGAITKAPFLPAGAGVTNPLPTWGGTEPQTVPEAERSIAAFVRHRDRMVAADDFAEVVRATPGTDLARVEVLSLVHPDLPDQQVPGVVTLVVLPRYDPASPDAPAPDQSVLRAVCEHVDRRRLVTTEIHLRGPVYLPVWVSVGVDVTAGRAVGPVREAVKAALRTFLSPLTGGHPGAGWPLLTPVNRLELLAVAARVDGVVKVFDVLLAGAGGTPVDQVTLPTVLHLPRLVGLDVRQGDPLPVADLQGVTEEPQPALPVPVIPEECC
ncbi:putative baseplate assembly protein [Geodermatophilus sp. SYSU D00804]